MPPAQRDVAVLSPDNRYIHNRTLLLLNVTHGVDRDNQIASSTSKASDNANKCALITGHTLYYMLCSAWVASLSTNNPDFSVVLFRPNFMLASEDHLMKT